MAYTKLESKLSKLQMSKDLKSAKFKKKKKALRGQALHRDVLWRGELDWTMLYMPVSNKN